MGINYFSEFKDPAKIARTGLRGSFVRISNSAQNRWKTYSIGKDMATASRALTLVGQVGSTFGGAVGAAALMSPVVAASAFAATVGGPQIAVTAGVLGLASLAYDSYSNRDQRHTELAKYAWSLIDDVRPQFDILSDPMHLAAAASHAMYLMKEGENQYKIMGSKLEAAQKTSTRFGKIISQREFLL